MKLLRHLRHEFWWKAEKWSGRLWYRVCKDGVSCWLDWLPSFCTRRRYAAHRALRPDLYVRRARQPNPVTQRIRRLGLRILTDSRPTETALDDSRSRPT
ncbi:hypothetical protein ABZ917_17395 [Nonomuraea wenchangensis]